MRDAGCLQYRKLIRDPTKQLINFDTLAVYSLVVNIAYADSKKVHNVPWNLSFLISNVPQSVWKLWHILLCTNRNL